MSDFEETWQATESQTVIPPDWADFFSRSGPLPQHFECRRSHPRFFLPAKALLTAKARIFAGYVKDISRSGVGILAPVQFLPLEHVGISLADGRHFQVDIARCVRIEHNCWECGTRFLGEGFPA